MKDGFKNKDSDVGVSAGAKLYSSDNIFEFQMIFLASVALGRNRLLPFVSQLGNSCSRTHRMDIPPKVRVLDTAQSFDTDLVIFRFLAITKIGVILLFLGTRGFRGLFG